MGTHRVVYMQQETWSAVVIAAVGQEFVVACRMSFVATRWPFPVIACLSTVLSACGAITEATPDGGDCERIAQSAAVKNAAFDEGHVGWTEEPSNVPVIIMPNPAMFTPDSGTFIARLAGTNSIEHTLLQTFDLPKQTTLLTVRARFCFETDEPQGVPARDVLTIVLRDATTNVKLDDIGQFSNIDAGPVCAWSTFEKEVNLSSQPGKVTLEFHAVVDDLNITSFNVDTLDIEAFGCP